MKKCLCSSDNMKDFGLFMLRLSIASIFIYAGWQKLMNIEMTAGFMTELGFPAGTFFAYLVGIVEVGGGLAVLLGIFTKVAGLLLATTMVVAILTAHLEGTFMEAALPVALLGSTFGLVAAGSGRWSLSKKECMCGK